MEVLGLLGLLLLSVIILGLLMESGDKKVLKKLEDYSKSLSAVDDAIINQTVKSLESQADDISQLKKQLKTVTEQLNGVTLSLLEKEQKENGKVVFKAGKPIKKEAKKPIKKTKK